MHPTKPHLYFGVLNGIYWANIVFVRAADYFVSGIETRICRNNTQIINTREKTLSKVIDGTLIGRGPEKLREGVKVVDVDVHSHEIPTAFAPYCEMFWRKFTKTDQPGSGLLSQFHSSPPRCGYADCRLRKAEGRDGKLGPLPWRILDTVLPGARWRSQVLRSTWRYLESLRFDNSIQFFDKDRNHELA